MSTELAQSNGAGPALLELEEVSASYGAFKALFGVSFSVPEGSAVALLGPNGAGKSTVARVATRLVPISGGCLRFMGEDVTRLPAYRLARMGVAHAPEGRSVFSSLTVEENLQLAFREALGKRGMREALERAYASFPRLGERRRQNAGTLSGGEQRMLSLAKVLANPPKLLVVDELSLGLAPVIVDEVFRTLRRIREAGTSILV
ncbi:MAG TPA: ABC transporter ATP-binding protein, partial [Acidimicrobiales bacterium]|nr:ABC transporter ATP-binding protein [Acidimicrobiales bacterium]